MPKKSPSPVATLAVVDFDQITPDQIRTGCEFDLLGQRTRAELERLTQLEQGYEAARVKLEDAKKQISFRGLLLGCLLQQVKTALGHGKFGTWKRQHCGGERNRQTNYLMRLARVFFVAKGVLMPEYLALPQTTLDLTGGPKEAASALKKARAFVGNRSLNELLELHGIKVRGGYHPSEDAVAKWLTDHHPKLAGKKWEQLDEELQVAYQASGYNERDWRTPAQVEAETRAAAEATLTGPVSNLIEELERPEWRQYVGPKQLTALRRQLGDAVAKVDRLIAQMEGRA